MINPLSVGAGFVVRRIILIIFDVAVACLVVLPILNSHFASIINTYFKLYSYRAQSSIFLGFSPPKTIFINPISHSIRISTYLVVFLAVTNQFSWTICQQLVNTFVSELKSYLILFKFHSTPFSRFDFISIDPRTTIISLHTYHRLCLLSDG